MNGSACRSSSLRLLRVAPVVFVALLTACMSDDAAQPTESPSPAAALGSTPTMDVRLTLTATAADDPATSTPEPPATATAFDPTPEPTATEAEPTADLSRLAVMHLPFPAPADCLVSPMHFEQIGEANPYPAFTFDDADLITPGISGGVLYEGENKVYWWFEEGVSPEITAIAPEGGDGLFEVSFGQALESPQAHPSSVTFGVDGCWQLHVTVTNTAGAPVAEHEWQVYVYPDRYRLRAVDSFGLSAAETTYLEHVGETSPSAENRFAVLDVTVVNIFSVDPLNVLDLLPQLALVTSSGSTVPVDVKLTEEINELDAMSTELTSGAEIDMQLVFEIPAADTGVTLVATTLAGTPVELALD